LSKKIEKRGDVLLFGDVTIGVPFERIGGIGVRES
jgi:hypothetical protein